MTTWADFRPTTLLGRLVEAGVDFVIVGGIAVVLQALPRFTKDLDLCYATDGDNLDRLGAVLGAVHARLRGPDEDPPFVADAGTLRQTQILTLITDDGDVDLLVDPPGAPPYPRLRAGADRMEVAGVEVLVASIADLVAMKRAAAGPQDLIDVEALEIARRRGGRRRRARR